MFNLRRSLIEQTGGGEGDFNTNKLNIQNIKRYNMGNVAQK